MTVVGFQKIPIASRLVAMEFTPKHSFRFRDNMG